MLPRRIAATQRRGQLQRGVNVLAFEHHPGELLPEGRYSGLTYAGAGDNAGAKAGLSQCNNAGSLLFDPLLVLVFGGQCFDFAGRARHLIHRIHHRFVITRDGEIVLRLGNIQLGV